MRRKISLTESKLYRLVENAAIRVLNESFEDNVASEFERYMEDESDIEKYRPAIRSAIMDVGIHDQDTVNDLYDEIIDKIKELKGWSYNPWENGDASWIDGKYDIPYGYHVEINSSYSYVSIEDLDEYGNRNEENSYFLQGDEADDIIRKIAKYWSENDCSPEEAVNKIIESEF